MVGKSTSSSYDSGSSLEIFLHVVHHERLESISAICQSLLTIINRPDGASNMPLGASVIFVLSRYYENGSLGKYVSYINNYYLPITLFLSRVVFQVDNDMKTINFKRRRAWSFLLTVMSVVITGFGVSAGANVIAGVDAFCGTHTGHWWELDIQDAREGLCGIILHILPSGLFNGVVKWKQGSRSAGHVFSWGHANMNWS